VWQAADEWLFFRAHQAMFLYTWIHLAMIVIVPDAMDFTHTMTSGGTLRWLRNDEYLLHAQFDSIRSS
jgi:hypothetical protein